MKDDRCCVNFLSSERSSVLEDVQRYTWLVLVVDRERTGVISGFAPANAYKHAPFLYVLIGLSSHLLPSTVACLTRLCSPSALLRAFPFTVALIEYPTSGKSVEPPVKGGPPKSLAVCLVRLLPTLESLPRVGPGLPVIRVQCDFLPIGIESRKK